LLSSSLESSFICLLSTSPNIDRRWEVYHGQSTEGAKWDAGLNPRAPGLLTLENFRFLFDDETLAALEVADDNSPEKLNAMKALAHASSPKRSGVSDELLALIRTEIFSLDNRGIPTLTKDWWSKVDLLLLDEMYERFGIQADAAGKHGVAEKIRKRMERKWARTQLGFAFASDPKDIIYDYEEFDKWRMAFEEKQQSRSEGAAGVHRFN